MRSANRPRRKVLTVASGSTALIGRAALAPVLAGPSVRAEQVTQLVLGETATIVERNAEWRRVRIHGDQYEGWINSGYVLEVADEVAAEWRDRATGWSQGAVVQMRDTTLALPLRARVVLEDGG